MSVNRTFHTLLVEDVQSDTQSIYELVAGVRSVQFTWENVLQLKQAEELLRVEPFDLVLLDLSLPDSQGLDTFIHLYPHALCLPVVVLTEKDDELLALQAVRSGAQDYLVKGRLEGEALVRSLCYALERKRFETALRVRNQQLTTLSQKLGSRTQSAASMDDLIASFVHELNNPLAKVSAQLEELMGQFDLNDTKLAALQSIQGEVERMGRLVGGLLQASTEKQAGEHSVMSDQIQNVLSPGSDPIRSQEARFFEGLGRGCWTICPETVQ